MSRNPKDVVNVRIEVEMHEFMPNVEVKSVILKRTSCGLSYIRAQEEV